MARQKGARMMVDATDIGDASRPTKILITVVVANRYTIDSELATGRQIKEGTNIPASFALYRRADGGNESISDDAQIELHNGDHFFARPASNASWPERTSSRRSSR
jgi:hypothetical protein